MAYAHAVKSGDGSLLSRYVSFFNSLLKRYSLTRHPVPYFATLGRFFGYEFPGSSSGFHDDGWLASRWNVKRGAEGYTGDLVYGKD
jgi:hypothetical protein